MRDAAARAWCAWEGALVSLETGGQSGARYTDPRFAFGFARLVAHYFAHVAWLHPTQLLEGAAALADIPAVLIHGRLDLGGPLEPAWLLHHAWPGNQLISVPTAGHLSRSLADHAIEWLDDFVTTPG